MAPATRLPPPQGQPPPYAFVGRVYRRPLRPVVICCGVIACIWTLIWAVGAFQDLNGDKENLPLFVQFDIALGVMYSTTALIEVYGIGAAISSRIPLVRVYSWASVLAALLVTAAEFLRISLHFIFQHQLVDECTRESSDTTVHSGSGFWGATTTKALTQEDAADWCQRTWQQTTFADIAWLIVASILGWLFSSLAFSFYHQLLDPSSVASRFPRGPAEQYGMGAYPAPYGNASPYGAGPALAPYSSAPGYGYSARGQTEDYVPPYPGKVPEYGSDYTLAATVNSAEKRDGLDDTSDSGHSHTGDSRTHPPVTGASAPKPAGDTV